MRAAQYLLVPSKWMGARRARKGGKRECIWVWRNPRVHDLMAEEWVGVEDALASSPPGHHRVQNGGGCDLRPREGTD